MFTYKIFTTNIKNTFLVLCSNKTSRSNTSVNFIIGALILTITLGNIDDELLQLLMFFIKYRYARYTRKLEELCLSDQMLRQIQEECLACETKMVIDLIRKLSQ